MPIWRWGKTEQIPAIVVETFPSSDLDNSSSCETSNVAVYNEILIKDSSDIHVGSKDVYNGKITINQIVYPGAFVNEVDISDECGEVIDKADILYQQPKVKHTEGQLENTVRHKFCSTVFYAIVVCLVLIATGAIVLYYYFTKTQSEDLFFMKTEYPLDKGIIFVQRTEWNARDPYDVLTKLVSPTKKIIIGHTVTSFCFDRKECIDIVNDIQRFHMDSYQFIDIGYHFLIGGNGLVFIGRGWNYIGEHTQRHNQGSICIALIGTFTNQKPSQEQISAVKLLIELGVNLTKISMDYNLYSQCQLRHTLSPGKYVHNIVSNWTHFASSNDLLKCNEKESTGVYENLSSNI